MINTLDIGLKLNSYTKCSEEDIKFTSYLEEVRLFYKKHILKIRKPQENVNGIQI